MSEWQLIETAPKDGTEVDVWGEYGRNTNVIYRDGKWKEWLNVFGTEGYYELDYEPTHWQPLPEPPQQQTGGAV